MEQTIGMTAEQTLAWEKDRDIIVEWKQSDTVEAKRLAWLEKKCTDSVPVLVHWQNTPVGRDIIAFKSNVDNYRDIRGLLANLSTPTSSTLKPITMKELQVNTKHIGRVLVVRVIVSTYMTDCHYLVVEDQHSNASTTYGSLDERIKSFGVPPNGSTKKCFDIGLRLAPGHKRLEEKKLAILLFLKRYHEIIPLGQSIQLRRKGHHSSTLTLAQAYFMLHRYSEALELYQLILKIDPDNENVKAGADVCIQAIQGTRYIVDAPIITSVTGELYYDLSKVYDPNLKPTLSTIDHEDAIADQGKINYMNVSAEDQTMIEAIYGFWFGPTSTWSVKYAVRSRLWFGRNLALDKDIKMKYETLLLEAANTDQVNGVYQRWSKFQRGRIALIILFDQFTRNMYRGSPNMFKYDDIALKLALECLDNTVADQDHSHLYSPPERIFIYLVLEHSESIDLVSRSHALLSQLAEESKYPAQRKLYLKFAKSALDHLETIKQFGRYPHRNFLLGRQTTVEEKEYLDKANNNFVRSVEALTSGQDTEEQVVPDEPSYVSRENQIKTKKKAMRSRDRQVVIPQPSLRPKLKIVLLHSFRQNGSILKRATKKLATSLFDVATIYFANAPLAYDPTGETRTALLSALGDIPQTMHQRQWWNSSKDNKVYHHLDASIHYLTQLFKTEGPFDGIIGFSQGAALTGILAALQQENKLLFNFKFAILISGFISRAEAHQPMMTPSFVKDLPALSILGTSDDLVDNDRTRQLAALFADGQLVEHTGGHFTPNRWPTAEIRGFLVKQLAIIKPEGSMTSATQTPLMTMPSPIDPIQELPDFDEKMEVSLRANRTRLLPNYNWKKDLVDEKFSIVLYGLSPDARTQLERSSVLKSLLDNPPTLDRSLVDINESVKLLVSMPVADQLAVVWATRLNFKQEEPRDRPLFYHLWLHLYLIQPDVILANLESFQKFATWRDIATLAYYSLILVEELSLTPIVNDRQITLLKQLRQKVVLMFATQLRSDYNIIDEHNAEDTIEDDTHDPSKLFKWPSSCGLDAPRIGGGRKGNTSILAKEIARFMFPLRQLPADATEAQHLTAKGLCYENYRRIISRLSNLLRSTSPGHVDTKVQMVDKENFKLGLSEETRQKIMNAPPNTYVLHPIPEPVFPCPLEELDPLLEFMKSDTPLSDDMPIKFSRGTCMPDGRLDLCKQVVGPEGIKPLLGAMRKHSTIKRLLLGNNIVGNGGAEAIADYIKNNIDSKIDTWYIAGNNFDEEGMIHIADALANDTKVRALWLKRNPLLSGGVRPIARMLETNCYLETLDLLNCGILDQGVSTLFASLMINTTLKHLYIDTNGLTVASAITVRKHLETGTNRLETIYMSCNYLGDKGAYEIAQGLASDKTLVRIGLCSNNIGATGAKALVDAIIPHPTLKFLNLGYTKATFVMGVLNNTLEDDGSVEIARLIRSNKVLRVIDLTNNGISQKGITALREALQENKVLTSLVLMQFAMVHNEVAREHIDSMLSANRLLWGKETLNHADEPKWMEVGDQLSEDVKSPQHVQEILSVYRTK
eukprot:gene18800-22483_t